MSKKMADHKKSPAKAGLSCCYSEIISPSRAKGEQGIFYGEGVSVLQYAIVSPENITPLSRAQQAKLHHAAHAAHAAAHTTHIRHTTTSVILGCVSNHSFSSDQQASNRSRILQG